MRLRTSDIARALDADPALVARWIKRGMPTTSIEEVRAWHAATIRPRRRLAEPEPRRADTAGQAAPSGSMAAQLLAERLRSERAAAGLAELKLAEQRGDLARRGDLKKIMLRHGMAYREHLLSIPSRLAAMVAAEPDQARCYTLLYDEIVLALAHLQRGAEAIDPRPAD